MIMTRRSQKLGKNLVGRSEDGFGLINTVGLVSTGRKVRLEGHMCTEYGGLVAWYHGYLPRGDETHVVIVHEDGACITVI